MLKKTLSAVLAAGMVCSCIPSLGFAQTEEQKIIVDNFENGLSDSIWNLPDSGTDTGLGEVKSDQETYLTTKSDTDAEYTYEYNASKEDIAFDISLNASAWKESGSAFEMYIRYVDENNYFKLVYTPSNTKFELVKFKGGTETTIASATKALEADKDYKLSLQAKHGIVRFELDDVVLIQDYTGIVNFDDTASTNSIKFKTFNQALKITSLSLREEDTLLHQSFENSDFIMTDSSDTASASTSQIQLPDTREVTADALKITGAKTFRIKQNDWEYANKGTDFEKTELTAVIKSNEFNGSETLHFRTTVNSDGKMMNLVKLGRDDYNIGDNYGNSGITGKKEAVSNSGYKLYGWRAFDHSSGVNAYRTYKVRTDSSTDKVTVTFTAEGNEWGKWEDTQPITPAEGKLLAGGFEITTTQAATVMYLKSYEFRDITGNDNVIYTDALNSVDKWTGAELVTVGDSPNKYYSTTASTNGTLVLADKTWKNILVESDISVNTTSGSGEITDCYAGVMARYSDANNYIMGAYSPVGNSGKGTVYVKSVVNGTEKVVGQREITAFEAGSTHKLGLNVKDGAAIIYVDGKPMLNAPFSTASAKLYGTIALKSNNLATKFDNITVSGSPNYFVEEFDTTAEWSGYSAGAKTSKLEGVTYNDDGTLTAPGGSEIYLYADETSTGDWDDIELKIRMKTTRQDLFNFYIRAGVDDTGSSYCIDNTEMKLRLSDSWSNMFVKSDNSIKCPSGEWFDIKLRLTDEKSTDGKDVVRVRYSVNGVEYFNYVDDGSVAATAAEAESNATIKGWLGQYPLTAKTHGRGFRISAGSHASTPNYIIDSITVSDPEAGTLLASVAAETDSTDATGSLTVKNKMYESFPTMFITALYNDNDELVDVKVSYPETIADDEKTYTQQLKLGTLGTATKFKVFAWDSWENMKPLDAAEKSIGQQQE